jgi:hypothetical protein
LKSIASSVSIEQAKNISVSCLVVGWNYIASVIVLLMLKLKKCGDSIGYLMKTRN